MRRHPSIVPDGVAEMARARGLAFRGMFHPSLDDAVPSFAEGAAVQTVMLLGWTGGEQWPVFAGSPEMADGLPDPLNRWSKRVVDEIADASDLLAIYPFGGPPHFDFQRWALKAEPVHRSPLGLLIHPEWGLWHSYRGALGSADLLPLAPPESSAHPCLTCREQPCLSACPVTAFAPPRPYDHAACRQHLGSDEADCLVHSCLARRACPIAPRMRYSAEQSAFHMRAFLGSRPDRG